MSPVSSRADFVAALGWIAFGVAIVAGALAMDRLERFGAKLYTAPGLVPAILGALIALLGLGLAVRSVRRGALPQLRGPWAATPEGRAVGRRTLVGTLLMLAYALLMVGHGLPFWLATVVFVFVFLLVFDLPDRSARGETVRGVVLAAIVAVVTSAAVTLLFQEVFLVRLP